MIEWCDSDTCQYYASVISLVSIWSFYFNFCLNLVSIFVKINNFVPLQIEIKFNFYKIDISNKYF